MAGFWDWLLNRASETPNSKPPRFARSARAPKPLLPKGYPPRLVQGGLFEIRGEAQYQDALSRICGGKRKSGAKKQCFAILSPEPTNVQDPNAIQVIIENQVVGYLAREHASEYQQHIGPKASSCPAKVVGGWKDENSEGHFGVKLKVKWPPRLHQ